MQGRTGMIATGLIAVLCAGVVSGCTAAGGVAATGEPPPSRVKISCGDRTFAHPEEARAGKAPGPCTGMVQDNTLTEDEKLALDMAGGDFTLGSLYALCSANSVSEALESFPDTPKEKMQAGLSGALFLCLDHPAAKAFTDFIGAPYVTSSP